MALVERVGRERFDVVPHPLDHRARVAALQRALDELGLERVDHVLDLLAHALAELLGLAAREAGHLHGDLHRLLLVHDQAVRLAEDALEAIVVVADGRPAVLARDELGDLGHRARTEERDHGHDVGEHGGRQQAQRVLHARRVDLEHAVGVCALVERERGLVVERDVVHHQADAVVELDVANGVGDHRERTQAQEVHLEQPEIGHRGTVVLRDDRAALGVVLDRDVVVQRIAADDDGGGVHALAAHDALQRRCRVDDALGIGIGVVVGLELGARLE